MWNNLKVLVHIVHIGSYCLLLFHIVSYWFISVHIGSYWFILVHIGSYWFNTSSSTFLLDISKTHFQPSPVPPLEVAFASLPQAIPQVASQGHGQASTLWLSETGVYHMCHMFMANSQGGLWMFTMISTIYFYSAAVCRRGNVETETGPPRLAVSGGNMGVGQNPKSPKRPRWKLRKCPRHPDIFSSVAGPMVCWSCETRKS